MQKFCVCLVYLESIDESEDKALLYFFGLEEMSALVDKRVQNQFDD